MLTFSKLNREFQDLESQRQRDPQLFNENQLRSLDALGDIVEQLQWKLFSISDLFNEVALPRKLWEIGLLLLHATRTENAPLAVQLLRSIIYR